jgi:beta-phosphoglucomutase
MEPIFSPREHGIVWDMDGTLVDTAELHYQAWTKLAQQRGLPFSRADFVATFGRRNPEIIQQLFGQAFSEAEMAALGEDKENLYRTEAQKGVHLLPGVRSLLEQLQEAGFLQAIGSSAPRKNLELILEITGTTAFFQAVVAMEDTAHGKPHPEVFLNAARKLQLPPERCLVIEDAVAGVQAARNGGMKCIAVTFVGHHDREKLQAAGADLIVASLAEVTVEQVQRLLAE